ncbi:hypothetical protein ABBQ38_008994 [Trebouxia sp. C0009 RCD-2024]
MSVNGAPAELQRNSLAHWLISSGIDQHAAESASRSLDVPCLSPLWNLLQYKLCTRADRATSYAHQATTANDPQQIEKLARLVNQVQGVMQQLNTAQAALQQQSETTILAESRKQHKDMQADTAYIQVLALEAFAKRAEKLLQLLAELGRRLQLRLDDAVHHSHSSPADSARPGSMQHVMLAASAALTDALKDSLSGQPDENIILPATLKTAQTAALVNEIRQWHACHTVAAIADNTTEATQRVHAMAAAFAPQVEAKELQAHITTGFQSIEEVLRAKQESHVRHFLQTEAALNAGRAAEEQLDTLRSALQGQMSLQEDLVKTRCEVAGSKAVIAVVQAQLVSLQADCQQGTNGKAELLHKWDMITSFQHQNAAMDDFIKLLFKENMVNKERWQAAATDTKQHLSAHLLPALGQVSKEVQNMHDCMVREHAAFAQAQLHQLPTFFAQGISTPTQQQQTLSSWRKALQDASQPQAAAATQLRRADGLLGILQESTRLQPATLVQMPDALLDKIVNCVERQQLFTTTLEEWHSMLLQAAEAATHSAQQVRQTKEAVDDLEHNVHTEGVSALKAAADTCDAAIAFAKNDVANAITEWWTQPAVNAVPWLKYEGKNAGEWLSSIRAIHAAAK